MNTAYLPRTLTKSLASSLVLDTTCRLMIFLYFDFSSSMENGDRQEVRCPLPHVSDEDSGEDFQTLSAVRRRFSDYVMRDRSVAKLKEQGNALATVSEVESSTNLSVYRTCYEEVADAVTLLNDKIFLEAIKRNRCCQELLRSKMTHIESKMEENKKLREHVKVFKDFRALCKRNTGQALALRRDPRIQLISARKTLEVNDKTVPAPHGGPMENSHVAKYRMALENFPLSLEGKKWTEVEKNKLGKGLRQQLQEIMFRFVADQMISDEGCYGDTNILDDALLSIRDFEITPEKLREFLPKVNWDQLASLHVMGRSGAECEQRWLNFEDPLINHGPWTSEEDKKILFKVQEKGITNWFETATYLGTNRTPSQCLARFQRSLNAQILKREWTEEEDAQLRIAVKTFGERDWQSVASFLCGRTGTQCSNRWKKTLHPDRKIVGTWRPDENKRLTVAVKFFGPKNWNNIANFVPGRTPVQCRERWTNSLDPSLNRNKWTEEEDSKLLAAVDEYRYCWSKVASCFSGRTDNQCWRRWKVLVPHDVPLLQAARKMKKAALIGNFVDRESEKPALGPNDFVSPQSIGSCDSNYGQTRPNKRRRGRISGGENGTRPE